MLTVTAIRDWSGLENIAAGWSTLADRAPDASPFHRPEWLIPWWRHFGSGELHALAFHREKRLTGLLPFMIHPWNGKRQVTLLGTGISDRLGLIADEECADSCAHLVWSYLEAHKDRWDVCDWQDLPASSPLPTAVPFPHNIRTSTPWLRAELPARISSELRRDLRRFTRILEANGGLSFETSRDRHSLLADLFRLHEKRWIEQGGPQSTLDQPPAQQFLQDVCRRFAAIGKLRIYVLRHSGGPCAMILGLLDRGIAWDLITGMDPALKRFSPGSLLLQYAIDDARREGAQAWDFLRGDEPYKLRWGARMLPAVRLRALPPS